MPQEDHWLPGFNFDVQEWFDGDRYETLAICRSLELARAAFKVAITEKPAGRQLTDALSGDYHHWLRRRHGQFFQGGRRVAIARVRHGRFNVRIRRTTKIISTTMARRTSPTNSRLPQALLSQVASLAADETSNMSSL
jgi:hypothetical protein